MAQVQHQDVLIILFVLLSIHSLVHTT